MVVFCCVNFLFVIRFFVLPTSMLLIATLRETSSLRRFHLGLTPPSPLSSVEISIRFLIVQLTALARLLVIPLVRVLLHSPAFSIGAVYLTYGGICILLPIASPGPGGMVLSLLALISLAVLILGFPLFLPVTFCPFPFLIIVLSFLVFQFQMSSLRVLVFGSLIPLSLTMTIMSASSRISGLVGGIKFRFSLLSLSGGRRENLR